jgi:hypothetical protein
VSWLVNTSKSIRKSAQQMSKNRMYKFIKDKDLENQFDNTTVRITVETASFDELVAAFKEFALACGYAADTVDSLTRCESCDTEL